MSTTSVSTPAVRINEIAYTGYPVTDLARARTFYEKVLGLNVSTIFEEGAAAWIEYDIGAGTLAISNLFPEWKPSADGPSVAFEVEDFGAAVEALRRAKVRFTLEPIDNPTCEIAGITDPDGNAILIHRRKPTAG